MTELTSSPPVEKAAARRLFVPRFQERPLLRPAHPVRAGLFLTLNLIGYAAASAFLCYLATGEWFVGLDEYAQAANRPLGYILIRPLNALTHPWLIVVFALLLTAVVIIPLLVACLYHSRYCVLFLACVAALAQAPVLTLILAVGCVLVAATPLRHKAPMLALLLGLLPVGAYLYFSASRLPILAQPTHRLMLYVPFVMVAVGSVLAGAIVLLIARLTRYLPGVIWPVTAVLVAVPAWLFFSRIGPAELDYAVLADQLASVEGQFAPEALSTWSERKALAARPADLPRAVQADLAERKAQVVARCNRFIRKHVQSPRLPAVWWIRGTTLDMQVSVRRLESGLVQFYSDLPPWETQAAERSAEHWQQMTQAFPDDVRSGEAWWRLALLALRPDEAAPAEPDAASQEQEILDQLDRANQMLNTAAELLAVARAPVPAASGPLELFWEDPGLPTGEYRHRLADRIAEVRWLLRVNGAHRSAANARAFMAYLSLDEDRYGLGAYQQEVQRLAGRFENTDMADNFRLADALCRQMPGDRASALRALEAQPQVDASIRANYELGLLALQGASDLLPAAEYFRRVSRDSGENPWRQAAEEHYQRLSPAREIP